MSDVPEVPEVPEVGSHWRHRKRGSVYVVTQIATMQVSGERCCCHCCGEDCPPALDCQPAVVYCEGDGEGKAWVRPLTEFMDGRFVQEEDDE